MTETNEYPFRIINNVYPDLNNYRYRIVLSDLGFDILIIEQWATGELYATIEDTGYQIPLRYNTNLLPSVITNKSLYYDFDRQSFILEELL